MKLIALWVCHYKRIHLQTFNFGSKHTFKFSFNENARTLSADLSDTPNYFNLFHPDDPIINITGIIGDNGAGKTTVLQLLNVVQSRKPLTHSVVLVFEREQKLVFRNYAQVRDENRIKVEFVKEKEFEYEIADAHTPFLDVDLLFYSNLYSSDHNDKYLDPDNKLNRSVTYQTGQSLYPERIQEYVDQYKKDVEGKVVSAAESFNVLRLYDKDKIHKLLTFLADVHAKYVPITRVLSRISFPPDINLWFNESIFANASSLITESIHDFKVLRDIYRHCYSINKGVKKTKDKLRNEIIYQTFFFAFTNDLSLNASGQRLDTMSEYVRTLDLDENIFGRLFEYLVDQSAESKFASIGVVKDFLVNMEQLLHPLTVAQSGSWLEENVYKFRIDKDLWSFLSQFLEIRAVTHDNLFTIGLTPFSSGEAAILNQFAQYYDALPFIQKDNVLVSIDEGELYLHPAWQREYINSLYEFLRYFNEELKLNKRFQLVITSHSPFIVSDMPKYNLIFLQKNKLGETIVSQSYKHMSTFGGNIFELYHDGFFLKDFISEFAYVRIDAALKFLRGEEQKCFDTLNEVEDFAKIIGESLIKEELEKQVQRRKITDFPNYFEIVKRRQDEADKQN